MKLEHPIQTLFAPISVLIIAYRFFCSKFFIFCVNILAFPLFKRYLAKHGMLRLCGTNEKEIQMHSCIWKALGLWAWLPIILRMKWRLIISARSQIDYIFFSTKLCLPFTEHTFFFRFNCNQHNFQKDLEWVCKLQWNTFYSHENICNLFSQFKH